MNDNAKKLPETIVLMGPAGCGKNTIADVLSAEYGYVQVALADPIKRFCAGRFGADPKTMWGPSELRGQTVPRFVDSAGRMGLKRELLHEVLLASGQHQWATYDDRLQNVIHREKVTTVRRLLQLVGTEWGRTIDPLLWCRHALRAICAIRDGVPYAAQRGVWNAEPQVAYQRPVVITDGRFENEATFLRQTARAIVVWIDDSKRNPDRPAPTHASEPTLENMRQHVHYVFDNNGTPEMAASELRSWWFQEMIFRRAINGSPIPLDEV